jgi:predicted transcriptional regulator
MEISKTIEIIKSLADTSRLRVLKALMEKPRYVEELAHRLDLAASTVSFHLKKLESAGLVNQSKEQYYIMYKVNDELMELSLRNLIDCNDIEKFEQDERIELYKQKVLRTFFKKNKLLQLPVQRKKRLIILDEFAKKFKVGKNYLENNVNEIITELYDDYCTIRRLLIEEGMMKRDKQFYWVTTKNERENNG